MNTLYRDFSNQAQIDAAYNPSLPSAGVADAAAEMAHYQAQAARARGTLPHRLGLRYGPTRAETLDIFPAAGPVPSPGAPVFVFFHGGYWRALSSADFHGVALGLQPLGITTVLVNYALCPQVGIDEITRQCRAALAWVLGHIGAQGGDARRVAIGGHSAGAHLAAMCLQTDWGADYGLPDDPFAAGLLVSGIYDLAPLRYSYLQPAIQLDDGVIRRQSPLFAVRRCATPLWITWGEAETSEFARQSQAFGAAWAAQGNAARLSAQPGAHHFSAIHGFEAAQDPIAQWLAARLGQAENVTSLAQPSAPMP